MKTISATTVTVVVIAILLALVAAYVAREMLEEEEPIAQEEQGVSVVVARVNLNANSLVQQNQLGVVSMRQEEVPEGRLTVPAEAAGRYVKSTITAGRPVLVTDLYPIGMRPSLAQDLTPGYRALPIEVETASGIVRLLEPGSTVDVTLTVEGSHPELGGEPPRRRGIGTLTLLKGIRVLSVPNTSARGRLSDEITVEVTPDQANRLVLAQRYGTLGVTLIGTQEAARRDDPLTLNDADDGPQDLVNTATLLGLGPIPNPPLPETAVIWRGGRRQVITFDPAAVAEARRLSEEKDETKDVGFGLGLEERPAPDAPPTIPDATPGEPADVDATTPPGVPGSDGPGNTEPGNQDFEEFDEFEEFSRQSEPPAAGELDARVPAVAVNEAIKVTSVETLPGRSVLSRISGVRESR